MDGRSPTQVGQPKCCPAIATVVSTQQGKQGGVLVDSQELSVTESPTPGCEITPEHYDLADKWFGGVPTREYALCGDDEVDSLEGLHIVYTHYSRGWRGCNPIAGAVVPAEQVTR
jgi:hypothetical protein